MHVLRVAGVLALAVLLGACATLHEAWEEVLPASEPEPVVLKPVVPDIEIPRGAFFTVNGSGAFLMDDADFGQLSRIMGYVLIGEGHAVACDHLVQARALQAMAGAGHAPAVGLEMVSVDKEPVLEGFSRGRIPVDRLEKAVDWRNVWGFPFAAYRPVFETAAKLGLPVAALNLPRNVVRSLSAKGEGGLTPEEGAWMPYRIIPAPAVQFEPLRQEFEMHRRFRAAGADQDAEKNKERDLDRFMTVQSAWDTKMAESAAETRNKYERPVAVLAGGGHVEHGWGIAYRLRFLDPGVPVLLVMPWRGDGPVDPAVADVFYHCPETHSSRLGFTLEARDKSALVVEVAPGSAAAKAGFAAGDLLTAAGGEPVDGLWSLHVAATKAKADNKPLVFDLLRDGKPLQLSLPAESGGPAGK